MTGARARAISELVHLMESTFSELNKTGKISRIAIGSIPSLPPIQSLALVFKHERKHVVRKLAIS